MSVISISSCKKDDPNDPTPDIPFYIQFDVNGSTVRYENGIDKYGCGAGTKHEWTEDLDTMVNGNLDTTCCTWALSEYTLFSKPTGNPDSLNNSIIVEMVELFNIIDPDSPSFNERFNMWAIGAKEYGIWSEDEDIGSVPGSSAGVVFTYTDDTGTVWYSSLLYGVQDNSAFEVTAHKAVSDELYNAISQGSFNCKLHDESGNSLTITNGQFKARTIQNL
jgi:hypothetical protein